jgi:hypothetical protein
MIRLEIYDKDGEEGEIEIGFGGCGCCEAVLDVDKNGKIDDGDVLERDLLYREINIELKNIQKVSDILNLGIVIKNPNRIGEKK